jgi:hypothetical protein
MAKVYLETDGRFCMEDYNQAKFLAGFLPGIAGPKGIPIWAYYINRGQCLAGFGFSNKDGALQEFVPADKAAWYTGCRGFRTFLKVRVNGAESFYEPFQIGNPLRWNITNRLTIDSAEISIVEFNHDLKIEVQVTYFALPGEPAGGLFRKTAIINHQSHAIRITAVDGLAIILPAGYNNFWAKNMGATIRAWMMVQLNTGIPFYQLKYLADDVPELLPVQHGHFFFGYRASGNEVERLRTIYDPAAIFGSGTDYEPLKFKMGDFTYPKQQSQGNNLASAFSFLESEIAGHDGISIYGLYGRVSSGKTLEQLTGQIGADYFERHREQNRKLVQEVKDYSFTSSGLEKFDQYLGQSFLDNVLRGGLPVTLNLHQESPKVFWLYSRKHGDLERDYNDFQLSPTFYSQGNGNFRDINQNRRNDVWFNTDVRDTALRYFWNLIQLDGYNPLVVKGIAYYYKDPELVKDILQGKVPEALRDKIGGLLEKQKQFTPGDLAHVLEQDEGLTTLERRSLLTEIIEHACETELADYREGYWIDHWTYNLDLLDAFLSIYPDETGKACWQRTDYTFYDSPAVLAPVNERYYLEQERVLTRNCIRMDPEKQTLIRKRQWEPNRVRVDDGKGAIYHTNLWVKMLILALNKLASFDPAVAGLEMDTGRPGWCDAVNGLPGILGSSVPEVFALKRLLQQMLLILNWSSAPAISIPAEIARFLEAMDQTMGSRLVSQTVSGTIFNETERYRFWKETHQIRDRFLQEVRLGFSGREISCEISQLAAFIQQAQKLVEDAIGRSVHPGTGLYHTYFYYRVTRWIVLKEEETEVSEIAKPKIRVWPEEFETCFLPEFLEGQVAGLRNETSVPKAQELYRAVRRSDLFDSPLEMYKVCSDLSQAPDELGRIRVFRRGWLENESIFLHMEYKYLLEILRCGMYEEFFTEFSKLPVCFLDPEVYGRSPLENSSFLVSSVYPEPDLHGNGFVARLSGSTAEIINIWLWMSFGFKPFRTDANGRLQLEFAPILTESFFSALPKRVKVFWGNGHEQFYHLPENCYAAKFLGTTLVIYDNPNRKPTFGPNAARVRQIEIQTWDGEKISLDSSIIEGEMALKVRRGWAEKILVSMD